MSVVQGKVLPQAKGGQEEMLIHLELSDMEGNPIEPGGSGVEWKPYPMGENGWKDYNTMFPADNYGSPMYAVLGFVVFMCGMVYTNDKTGHFPAIPAEARPMKRQRLILNVGQAFFSCDMCEDGRLKTGANGVINPSSAMSLNCFYRLD